MVESMTTTLTSEWAAASDLETLKERAKADFDRFHCQAKKPEKVTPTLRDGKRVGLVWITMSMPFRDEEHKAWLMEMYMVPRTPGPGINQEVDGQAEEWAKTQETEEIWLNAGGGNSKALGLYGSRGYHVETLHLSKKL